MRKVLVISSLAGGGSERAVTVLSEYWAMKGQDVAVVTLSDGASDAYTLAPSVTRVALGLLGESRSRATGMARAARRIGALRRAIARLRPDMVLSFGDRTNVLVLLATVGLGVPTFAVERTDPRWAPNGPLWKLARRVAYLMAAGVVVQTENVARWARLRWPRVRVIPNFVEATPYVARPGSSEGDLELLAVGRLEPVKGFDILIRAFAEVAAVHDEWRLTILGEGPERERLERLTAELGLDRKVSMPGWVRHPSERMARSHAFALPSNREGFPNALLEAMASGLPAVAFDCASGPGEIISHERDGILVPPGDANRLAAALEHLMANAAERERMGAAAREAVQRYAPERIMPLWSDLLGEERLA